MDKIISNKGLSRDDNKWRNVLSVTDLTPDWGEFFGLLHWQSNMICRDRHSAEWVSILWYGQPRTVSEILQKRQLSLLQPSQQT